MVDIDVRRAGDDVAATLNDRLIVVLPENATTGYQWSIEEIPVALALESSDLVPPREAAPGAAGERRIVLRARETGQGRLVLGLTRPWESQRPTETFEINVTVQ